MSYLVDTNVLLRLAQPKNPHQREADNALRTLQRRGESLAIIPQNLIEFWAVATRPATYNGLGLTVDETAAQIGSLKLICTLLPDRSEIFSEWERIVLQYQVSGKQVHDARLVAAMRVYDLTNLLTFNVSDFKRFSEVIVVNPNSLLD